MTTKNGIKFSGKMKKYIVLLAAVVVLYGCGVVCASESGCIVEKGDYVVIAGDSITEQMLYSSYVETYMLVCEPELDHGLCGPEYDIPGGL